jgi:hypothetical protein
LAAEDPGRLTLDDRWLASLGVPIDDEELVAEALLLIRGWWESWVGAAMTSRMDSTQLDAFDAVIDDEEAASGWLAEQFPDHTEIVREQRRRIGQLIASDPDGFVAAVRASLAG